MVKIEELAWEKPERPWLSLGLPPAALERAIREFARQEGYVTLRGYWAHMKKNEWDYYNILQFQSP